jgi:hypothetical protein
VISLLDDEFLEIVKNHNELELAKAALGIKTLTYFFHYLQGKLTIEIPCDLRRFFVAWLKYGFRGFYID